MLSGVRLKNVVQKCNLNACVGAESRVFILKVSQILRIKLIFCLVLTLGKWGEMVSSGYDKKILENQSRRQLKQ